MANRAQEAGHKEILTRIDSALSFAESVLRQADPDLVSAGRIAQLQSTADEVGTAVEAFHPETAPDLELADQAADHLLDAVAALPHRPIEKAAEEGKALAKSFQRSARQRERSVRDKLRGVEAEARGLEKKLEETKIELDSSLDERAKSIEARAAEVGAQLEATAQAQSQLLDQHRAEFESMQQELRSNFDAERVDKFGVFDKQREEADGLFKGLLDEQREKASDVISELERKDADAEQIVGSISIRGTADRYEKEAKTQAAIADRWRRATVVIGLLAGVVAGSAAFLSDQDPAHIAGKLALGLLLAGVAGYTARQSAQHRHREERASKLHLDLAAFGPFIEPLPEEAKNEERVLLGRRVFAREDEPKPPLEHGTSLQGLIPGQASDGQGAG